MTTAWKSAAWVEVSDEATSVVLRMCGELDLQSSETIEAVVDAAIDSCPAVTLDLSALEFCDSSGIAMFLRAQQRAAVHGTTLELSGARPIVARVFEVTGVEHVLPIASD